MISLSIVAARLVERVCIILLATKGTVCGSCVAPAHCDHRANLAQAFQRGWSRSPHGQTALRVFSHWHTWGWWCWYRSRQQPVSLWCQKQH